MPAFGPTVQVLQCFTERRRHSAHACTLSARAAQHRRRHLCQPRKRARTCAPAAQNGRAKVFPVIQSCVHGLWQLTNGRPARAYTPARADSTNHHYSHGTAGHLYGADDAKIVSKCTPSKNGCACRHVTRISQPQCQTPPPRTLRAAYESGESSGPAPSRSCGSGLSSACGHKGAVATGRRHAQWHARPRHTRARPRRASTRSRAGAESDGGYASACVAGKLRICWNVRYSDSPRKGGRPTHSCAIR